METVGQHALISRLYNDPEIKVFWEWMLFFPLRHNGRCVGAVHVRKLYKLSTNKHWSTIIQGLSIWIHLNNVCVKIEQGCTPLWVKLARTDHGWYLWSSGHVQTGLYQIFSIIHIHLATTVCFDQGIQVHRNTQLRNHKKTSRVDILWLYYRASNLWLYLYRFLATSVLNAELRWCVFHCSGSKITHPAFLIPLREHTQARTDTKPTHTFISSNQVRGLSALRQLIIFPAPETDGEEKSQLLAGGWRRWSCRHLSNNSTKVN